MKKCSYTNLQLVFLMLLRFMIGWHLLYEGFAKLLNPQWSSSGFLKESQWILSGFANWIVSDPAILNAVDFLNTWGLIAIGLGLILGLFFRVASVTGAFLLLVYYLNCPPLIGIEYNLPSDGNYLIVDKTLIEAVTLCVLALFPTGRIFGLDAIIFGNRNNNKKRTK
jgi:thiosulfate dehydrogenase (quinone) large subunit